MSNIPNELRYTKEHEWVAEVSGNRFRIGITDYAQGALGDIVYVQLPKDGELIRAGAVCGEVESTKSVSEIYAPISGVVVSVNSELDAQPEKINVDPYGMGWLVEVEVAEAELEILSELLTPEEYRNLTA